MSKPIYLAVADVIENDVLAGNLRSGERMPTHRKLADTIGVTPGTVNRIYQEAARRGLLTAVVGRGTFVTADAGRKSSIMDVTKEELAWDMGIARPLTVADPDLWPVIRKTLNKRRLLDLMRYSDPQGLPEHRAAGADWLTRFGLKVPPQNIVITAGAQNALFLICNSLLKAGERVATDNLTFTGMKAAAQRNGLRLEGVPMDSAGMLPDELDALCRRHTIKALYVSGRIQSPTNCEMPFTRRQELREVIRKHGLQLVENDSYGLLSRAPDRHLTALLPDESIYIAGLSKGFAAGLRVAYVAAPPGIARKIAQGVADTMLFVPTVNAEIASECLRSGLAEAAILTKRDMVARRVAMFRKIFENHVFECLDECMFAWLKLPPFWKGLDLETEAAKRNMRVMSSVRFAVGPTPPVEAVRVSLAGMSSAVDLRKALTSLERLVSKLV
ncbi:MAG: PLP-dependent aminotransferase family protein [Deltaproteobacteria bacterium]|nr:PLP-dependent aminotransferase family protein [Deltaproteobacteria bacterium]